MKVKFKETINTSGKGLWSNVSKDVKFTYIEISEYYIDVYFDNRSWNIDKYGLIYSDNEWLNNFKNILIEKYELDSSLINAIIYTEQGLQGYNRINLEILKLKNGEYEDCLDELILELKRKIQKELII